MIAALDVQYNDDSAQAAAVVFNNWGSEGVVSEYTSLRASVAAYEPGNFYLRELSPLLDVIRQIKQTIGTYVIDGYCYLSVDNNPGLGAYLFESLPTNSSKPLVVGVAKNRFRKSRHAVKVYRGASSRPLFVTSIGIEYEQAAQYVKSMHGDFRIPTLLKAVVQLARS